MVCAGSSDGAAPTIAFENGAGPTLSTWRPVMNEIATTARACAYDRAGTGQSDDVAGPRTTRDESVGVACAEQCHPRRRVGCPVIEAIRS